MINKTNLRYKCYCGQINNNSGFILLEHRTNEAEIEKYVGLHQFNLCVKDNDFYIWNKKEEIKS